MSELNQLKLAKLNEQRKQTQQKVTQAIASLNSAASEAMKQQAYMRKNPDMNGADELIAVATPGFEAASTAFNEVAGKLQDMQAVSAGTMTVDDFIVKNNIDLAAVSDGLI